MATDLYVDRSLATIIGFIGLFLLLTSWRIARNRSQSIAVVGWVLTGFYFFNDTPYYLAQNDSVLTVMSASTLPGALAIAWWEVNSSDEKDRKALHWFRGAVGAAGLPYLLIAHIPWLSVIAIWFVAWQACFFLSFAGGQEIQLGETYVNPANGNSIAWSEWDGNRWFLSEEMREHSFHTQLVSDTGEIGINFVLACTAIQSMIIFVGAISVLDMSWKKRVRALFISLTLIHILNLFRNAGLIWLQLGYPDWIWLGLNIFDFGHIYASRFGSLAAMFLLALVLFEMLPQMHRHVLRLLSPLNLGKRPTNSVK
ncbi:MAG: archaeosortase A [Candidatus Poseidoniaceae archaeon]|jgi:archaeosortase A (PGF-CTERM-specific)|nr:archaeosortase A [Candidatus Poseidoniaceae archaeon]